MPPRQNKKQRRCTEYRQEHLPEEHALEQSGNAGERQDEKNEEQTHGEGQDLEQKKYSLFFQARLKSKAASYSGTEKGRENKKHPNQSTARQVRFRTA